MGRGTAIAARNGTAVALPGPRDLPAGYSPGELDNTIKKYVAVAETNIRHASLLEKRVQEALENVNVADAEDRLDYANKVTILWERLAKTGMALTKALDELTRLRSFIAGGPDSRPDLTVKGELQLQGIILQAVKMIGREAVLEVLNEGA